MEKSDQMKVSSKVFRNVAVLSILTMLQFGAFFASSAQSKDSDYIGSDICKGCHENLYDGWTENPHWRTTLEETGGPSRQGCEACHGAAKNHVDGGGDKTEIFAFKESSPAEINRRCLTCHLSGVNKRRDSSSHRQNQLSCLACHSQHHATTKKNLLIKAQS
jgi:hypothetical protein